MHMWEEDAWILLQSKVFFWSSERFLSLLQDSSCLTSLSVGCLVVVGDEPYNRALVRILNEVLAVLYKDTAVGKHGVKEQAQYTAQEGSGFQGDGVG